MKIFRKGIPVSRVSLLSRIHWLPYPGLGGTRYPGGKDVERGRERPNKKPGVGQALGVSSFRELPPESIKL